MAQVGYMGPYSYEEELPPGKATWVQLGEHDGLVSAAISVSAVALDGKDGSTHVLKVQNINTTTTETNQGDLIFRKYHLGCEVMNNGQTTVQHWQVLVGVIQP